MKNIINNIKWVSAVLLVVVYACDENKLEPLENNMTPPGIVSNVLVENLPGESKLTYTLPDDQDLLYVKAEYKLNSGRMMEVKSSYYNNSLTVEGFANEEEQEVKLYAYNRSEIASEPVTVNIHPLESPIWDVFRSLSADAAFGGVRLTAKNPLRHDLAILLMEKNQQGDWEIHPNSVYTSTDSINKTIRGFSIKEHEFAVTVRDRWLNTTDTLFANVTPFVEEALPKANYKHYPLPGDTPSHTTAVPSGMWDGNIMDWPRVFLTQGAVSGQHIVTIDTGVLAKMSRIVIWDYPEYYNGRTYYYIGNLKEFEIWGSANPNPDGSLDESWVKLGSYNAVKPSGLPFGEQTDEDYQTANAGFSWEFDVAAPKVRYLRIKSLKNWAGIGTMAIGEIQVYGNPN
ncbi:DUF4959 domain-containing protein [Aestuariibaculum sediminum]|uniref:DUF4959 domain-containing protein n=1 Tax=Aestuariibaculum sediminum TaxID=2770637 RepID=A0A8J6Q218_9FLAO|nr:DUF4959 domain-containing protein [Aestuariibaculum sediminum]MBD0831544.1 DUF4959 domain-containing protein [Aestuariibaculum sediminum]